MENSLNDSYNEQLDLFHVNLDGFEGPLDLLLSLAKEQKVDLLEISILELASQYLNFIDQMKKIDIDLAADYIVMASWLAFLKSKLLLPDQDDDKRLKGEIYYKNFNWLDTWTTNHFKEKIFYNMGIYIVILLSCFFILKIKFNKIYETKINYVRTSQFPYKIMLTISTLGIIIWFLKVPVFRFGYSFLTLFIISILLIILNKILIRKKIILNLFSLNFLVILCISAIVLKQAVRFEKKYDVKYYNYPWVKFYGSSVENNPVLNKTIKYNNIVLYRVPEADDQLCYFSKSICTPQNEVDKKIKYEIKNNYKFFSIIKSKN